MPLSDEEVLANLPDHAQELYTTAIQTLREATKRQEWDIGRPEDDALVVARLCRDLAETRMTLADVSWHRNALGQRLVELCPEHIQLDVARLLKGDDDGA